MAKSWKRYRLDHWGWRDPFVCLWGVVVPGDGPGLTIDPCCVSLLKEILGYSYEKTTNGSKPQEHDNHACDALRYMVTSVRDYGIHGHLHIYREIYEPNSAAKGLASTTWPAASSATVVQKSSSLPLLTVHVPDNIRTYYNLGIPCQGYRFLGGAGVGEIDQGITQVNAYRGMGEAQSRRDTRTEADRMAAAVQTGDLTTRETQTAMNKPIFG